MSEPFIGEIRMFAGNFAPQGWALCDGQLLAIAQNDALFSLFGTIYGGDGRTTFALPEMRGRIPLHQGSGPGLSSRPIGQRSGSQSVNLTAAQVPSHTHPARATSGTGSSNSPENAIFANPGGSVLPYKSGTTNALTSMSSSSTSTTGSSQAHTNEQPYLCVNFIVSLFGVYPSRS